MGFAIARSLGGPVCGLNSFLVVRSIRGLGVGLQSVGAAVAEHPGPCDVAFPDANAAAVHFWR